MPTEITLDYRGQHYIVEGFEPYQRKDGSFVELAIISSHCAECGAPFLFKATKVPGNGLNRRCDLHKQPGRKARRAVGQEPDTGPVVWEDLVDTVLVLRRG